MSNKSVFEPYTNSSKVRYFRLGRHAFLAALKILQLQPGDLVLVPAFICRDLLASIHAVGAIPVFYEVSRGMRPVNLPNVGGVCAVIAVNYFGFPQDLSPYRIYCERNGSTLIEDNAHGYLSCDETGMLLGTRGDLGIFSIRKTLSLPDGAMLIVNNAELKSRMDQQLPCRKDLLPINFWIKRGLTWLQRKTGITFLAIGKDLVRFLRYLCTGHTITPLSLASEFEMPPEPAPHCRSIAALPNLDQVSEIARRRRLYGEFHKRLTSLNIQPVFGTLPAGVAPYGYPFYSDAHTAKVAIKLARKQGFDCAYWPDLPANVVQNAPLYYQSLLIVNFIC